MKDALMLYKSHASKRARAFQSAALVLLIFFSASAQTARKRPTGALKVITGQPASYVYINNILHGATNEQGELDLPRAWAGTFPVTVRTVGFMDWTGSVTVAPKATRTLKVTQRPTTDEATIHFQKGELLRYRGKSRDSIEEYRKAIELRPGFTRARIALARSLISVQDYQGAEENIRAAIKSGGATLAEAQTVLANLRRNQGLVEEAIEEYKKALRLARNVSPEAHIGLGIAYRESNELSEAIKEYYAGLAQDMDTEPILYYHLAEMLESQQRNKEAIAAYENYIRLDPEGELASAAQSIIDRLKEERQ
jgi:predicted Zn-dependent protease